MENSRTFQGYPSIFQFSRTFQEHDAFSRTFHGLCETWSWKKKRKDKPITVLILKLGNWFTSSASPIT